MSTLCSGVCRHTSGNYSRHTHVCSCVRARIDCSLRRSILPIFTTHSLTLAGLSFLFVFQGKRVIVHALWTYDSYFRHANTSLSPICANNLLHFKCFFVRTLLFREITDTSVLGDHGILLIINMREAVAWFLNRPSSNPNILRGSTNGVKANSSVFYSRMDTLVDCPYNFPSLKAMAIGVKPSDICFLFIIRMASSTQCRSDNETWGHDQGLAKGWVTSLEVNFVFVLFLENKNKLKSWDLCVRL